MGVVTCNMGVVTYNEAIIVICLLQQMADKIGDHMKANKVKFLRTSVPTQVSTLCMLVIEHLIRKWVWFSLQIELVKDDGQRVLKVTYKNTETNEIKSEEYNTVSNRGNSSTTIR